MKVRPYQPGDEFGILELDARELPSKWNARTLENWRWKFLESNPAGKAFIWVAEHNGRLIAHFAAVPYRLRLFGSDVVASHSIGALVDGKYQNRGLLKLVGDRLLEELRRTGVVCTWGFPNQRAYQFEKDALGYQDLISFDQWRIEGCDLPDSPIPGEFLPVTTFGSSFDTLWSRCAADYGVITKRDSSYLNWRFIQRPDLSYHPFGLYRNGALCGYVVLKLYREEQTLRGHIVDVFAHREDSETWSALVAGGLLFFRHWKVDEVTVWFWGNRLVEQSLLECGFQCEKLARPLILKVNEPALGRQGLTEKSNWYFTMSDSTEIF